MSILFENITSSVKEVSAEWSRKDTGALTRHSAQYSSRTHRPYVDVSKIVRLRLGEKFTSQPSYLKLLDDRGGVDFFLSIMLRHSHHALQAANAADIGLDDAVDQIGRHYADDNSIYRQLAGFPNYIVTEQEKSLWLLDDAACYFDPERSSQFDWQGGRLAVSSLVSSMEASRNYLLQRQEEEGELYDERGRVIDLEGKCPAFEHLTSMGSALFEICAKDPTLAAATFDKAA